VQPNYAISNQERCQKNFQGVANGKKDQKIAKKTKNSTIKPIPEEANGK